MGSSNSRTIDRNDLYDGYKEGYYYPSEPFKAYKKITCGGKECIAHLILRDTIYKKKGPIYIDGDFCPSFELISKNAYVTRITDENNINIGDIILCKDENGEKYYVDKYIPGQIVCQSKI